MSGVLLGGMAAASETTIYSYDALGRLVATTRSGGPNNGVAMATCFDAAGNRTAYVVGTGGTATCGVATPTPTPTPTPTTTPTPTPTPTSGNQPPVTTNDSVSLACHTSTTINLTANDTDPENNVPLVLTSVVVTTDPLSTGTTVSIISGSTVQVNAGDKGASTFTYTVADSLGASSTGLLSVTSTGGALACAGG